ncbi:MAG: hypothetical protein CMM99_00540 [Rickettsiales bacterium]|nr:hypothetical protein [Rickettsiales bacterium]
MNNIIEKFEAEILFDHETEVIIQFSGTQIEISKFIKTLRPFNIVELTRSGLVSMALGTDYIKKGLK